MATSFAKVAATPPSQESRVSYTIFQSLPDRKEVKVPYDPPKGNILPLPYPGNVHFYKFRDNIDERYECLLQGFERVTGVVIPLTDLLDPDLHLCNMAFFDKEADIEMSEFSFFLDPNLTANDIVQALFSFTEHNQLKIRHFFRPFFECCQIVEEHFYVESSDSD